MFESVRRKPRYIDSGIDRFIIRPRDQRPSPTASTLVTVHPTPLYEILIHHEESRPQISDTKHNLTKLNNTPAPRLQQRKTNTDYTTGNGLSSAGQRVYQLAGFHKGGGGVGFSKQVGCSRYRLGGVESQRSGMKHARILKTTEVFFMETTRLQKGVSAVRGGGEGGGGNDVTVIGNWESGRRGDVLCPRW